MEDDYLRWMSSPPTRSLIPGHGTRKSTCGGTEGVGGSGAAASIGTTAVSRTFSGTACGSTGEWEEVLLVPTVKPLVVTVGPRPLPGG